MCLTFVTFTLTFALGRAVGPSERRWDKTKTCRYPLLCFDIPLTQEAILIGLSSLRPLLRQAVDRASWTWLTFVSTWLIGWLSLVEQCSSPLFKSLCSRVAILCHSLTTPHTICAYFMRTLVLFHCPCLYLVGSSHGSLSVCIGHFCSLTTWTVV